MWSGHVGNFNDWSGNIFTTLMLKKKSVTEQTWCPWLSLGLEHHVAVVTVIVISLDGRSCRHLWLRGPLLQFFCFRLGHRLCALLLRFFPAPFGTLHVPH